MNKNITAANLSVVNTPNGASLAMRGALPTPRRNVRAFTVSLDTYEQEIVISRGFIAVYKICPDKRLIIPAPPQPNEGESGSYDSEGNLRFPASEYSPNQEYEVVAILNAEESKGNFISIREASEDLEDDEIEDCQRVFKIAKFTLRSDGSEIVLNPEDLHQIWESDIVMSWEDLSANCCSADSSDSDFSLGSDDSSFEGSGSDSDDSDEETSLSESMPGSCPCPTVEVYPRVVLVGEDGICFTTGLIEDVLMEVLIFPQPIINCPEATFGDLQSIRMTVQVLHAGTGGPMAQEWRDSLVTTRFEKFLSYNNAILPNRPIQTFVKIPAQCGMWIKFRTVVTMHSRLFGVVSQKTCNYFDVPLKLPGIMVFGEVCSQCANEQDSEFEEA